MGSDDIPEISGTNDVFFVIGIGASAGGLEALKQFFENMSENSGMAFVIIQHLSPDYKSLMAELLSKHTKMKVNRVTDGMMIESNQIYLIPPKKNMHVFGGRLYLTKQPPRSMLNLPIDIFFRSLAEEMENRAVGIILSGTGSDGTLGIRAIKGSGGMVMVQDDTTAKFDGMPRSAISTGLVDYILPPDKMPDRLLKYIQHPFIIKQKQEVESVDTLSKILMIIKNQTKFDFTFYKSPTITRRVERRIGINQFDSIEDYLEFLEKSPREARTLSKELLIGVTKFFREKDAFEVLKQKVIPEIFRKKKLYETIRIWTVGCSTGEEAYSLAILFNEYMQKTNKMLTVQIFATDIDRESIEYASAGIYPASIVTDVDEEILKKYFEKRGDYFKINETIRRMVVFASHNIAKDPPFSKIDLISCRNLLIYFKPKMQKRVISLFRFALKENGFLFLGSSESIGELTSYFASVSNKWKVYKCLIAQKPKLIGEIYPQITTLHVPKKKREREVSTFFGENIDETLKKIGCDLFEEYMPPAFIVNDNIELTYTFKNAHRFIKLNPGKPDLNILNLVSPDISPLLGTAIHKALKSNTEIYYPDVPLKEEDEIHRINIKVRPIRQKFNRNSFLIIFEPVEGVITESTTKSENRDNINQRLSDMEQELQYTRENLQATIEELETSNEELQATNQELIASNEELQSANEELQSLNEELYTVNSEHQNKIEELTELNNDINNWLSVTSIGSVFLDLNMRLRKFTPLAKKAINIIDSDMGRFINHLSYNFKYDKFFDKIKEVVSTLKSVEAEVLNEDGTWFLLKITPYRTMENAVKGVAITFIDITERKLLEEKLVREHKLLVRILENSSLAKTIIDSEGKFTFANTNAQKMLKLKKEEANDQFYNSPQWKHFDLKGNPIEDKDFPFNIIMRTRKSLKNYRCIIRMPDGEELNLSINGSPVFGENQKFEGVVFSLVDIDGKNPDLNVEKKREVIEEIIEE